MIYIGASASAWIILISSRLTSGRKAETDPSRVVDQPVPLDGLTFARPADKNDVSFCRSSIFSRRDRQAKQPNKTVVSYAARSKLGKYLPTQTVYPAFFWETYLGCGGSKRSSFSKIKPSRLYSDSS